MTLSEAVQRHCNPEPRAEQLRLYLEQTLGVHYAVMLRSEELNSIPKNLDMENWNHYELGFFVPAPEIDQVKLKAFLKRRQRNRDALEGYLFQVERFLLTIRRKCSGLTDNAVRELLLAPLSWAPVTADDKNSPKPIFPSHLTTVLEGIQWILAELEEVVARARNNDMKVRLSTPPDLQDFFFAQRKLLQAFRKFIQACADVD